MPKIYSSQDGGGGHEDGEEGEGRDGGEGHERGEGGEGEAINLNATKNNTTEVKIKGKIKR